MSQRSLLELADDCWQGRATASEIGRYGVGHLEEVADGVAMVPGFGSAFPIRHEGGVSLFDTGPRPTARAFFDAVRRWTPEPLHYAVYSHGHIDHVFGLGPFDEEADQQGRSRPVVVAHENVLPRFERYQRTLGYNGIINQRQFGNARLRWPSTYRIPDVTYRREHLIRAGERELRLTHQLGETDDATVGYLPDAKVLFPGDLFLWVTPNAGNPQKVQRYPVEWAHALRWMADLGAEVMLGSHGVPVVGADRIRQALEETAAYLETLVEQTLEVMNRGGTVLEAIHEVRPPAGLADRPYLQPVYDEPEFVVRNTWRLYGGWYDGNPAHLKPAPESAVAAEIAALCGGAAALADRAAVLAEAGDHRLAGHLAQLAVLASPEDAHAHEVRAAVFSTRAEQELSTMSKGVFGWAAAESRAAIAGTDTLEEVGTGNPHFTL
ncbi:alkyl sulfatase dimerization domain-containing protein [Nocardioides insulae]|uniref:alkyl sulfatase dimerization domain-containing protein n=1 Tax=Nocardioides insulae TaxID=394734 RepID=UPI000417BF96|nr:alkyl sulfatase dimerization domain-containing protein [Nocardioides insulae]